MDTDENLYFDGFEKKSLSEIQELFQNLKHIGMSEKDIDKYALAYKEFFEKRVKATEEIKIYNTSIPWRKELMEKNSTFSEVSKDQVQTDLSQSVVSQHSSS
jgi:hypothetical protein